MALPPDESVLVAVSLGNKIRALRQRLKLTLDETSTIAGISKPFLSQVERGRATPSITSLVRIAKALGVTMQYFIDTPTEARSVCRGNALQYFQFTNSASRFARLTNPVDSRKLDAILVRMPAGQLPSEMTTHAGEEFVYVLRGQLALTLEDYVHAERGRYRALRIDDAACVAQYGRRRGGDRLGRYAQAVLAKAAGRKEKYPIDGRSGRGTARTRVRVVRNPLPVESGRSRQCAQCRCLACRIKIEKDGDAGWCG